MIGDTNKSVDVICDENQNEDGDVDDEDDDDNEKRDDEEEIYGLKLGVLGRVPQADQILYQTERYHGATFGYDMPVIVIKQILLCLCDLYLVTFRSMATETTFQC